MTPNLKPKLSCPHRLAIIGEAPGFEEERQGEPFVGASGRFLKLLVSRAGFRYDYCYVGNISQDRPPGNEISRFTWSGPEVQAGLSQLTIDIREFKPNLILLLGNVPLKAAMDPDRIHPLMPGKYAYSVANWRGSLFRCNALGSPFFGFKCMASYHPAYVLRDYECAPVLQFDLKKAVREAQTPDLILPQRSLKVNLSAGEIIDRLDEIRQNRLTIAIDIEGYVDRMSCISVAPAPDDAFIIPFMNGCGSCWNIETEGRILRALDAVLSDPQVPKILQNSLYDRFVLQYSYGIVVRGVVDDTMLKHWELFCELEKSLGFQASIYTNEPYYKFERKSDNFDAFYNYCCKDSAVTYEISKKQDKLLTTTARTHYSFNMSMLDIMLYMELRGIRYDSYNAKLRRDDLRRKMFEQQYHLNRLAGRGLTGSLFEAAMEVAKTFCLKRDLCYVGCPDDLVTYGKKDFRENAATRVAELLNRLKAGLNLSASEIGELETLLDIGINVGSTKFRDYLYEELRCPIQTNKENQPTANYEALLKILKKSEVQSMAARVCEKAIEIRGLATRTRMLSIHADRDGRIRCGYNVVGTETGRVTCYTSPTGSGYNLQTIPAYDRDLFLADDGFLFFERDLSGADGWTVAAYCKLLGDPTMYDDYRYGLKPAKIICLQLRGSSVNFNDRAELKEASKSVSSHEWDYFASKMGQHGSSYLMGAITLSNNILTYSEGKCVISVAETKRIQQLFFQRYPGIPRWHAFVGTNLSKKPVMTAASGHTRMFFGRTNEVLTEALAFEPQANTTYATNLAARNLWFDPENRRSDGSLIIEPLHQVHDALCGQFPEDRREWAVGKLKTYFQNTLIIAHQPIIIPFEGGEGRSWGNCK